MRDLAAKARPFAENDLENICNFPEGVGGSRTALDPLSGWQVGSRAGLRLARRGKNA